MDVLASFQISKSVSNPKINGVRDGYAPHHKFNNVDYLASGFHSYDDKNMHYPGETLNIGITFPSWEYIKCHIKIGDSFEVREMDRVIGEGVIKEIL